MNGTVLRKDSSAAAQFVEIESTEPDRTPRLVGVVWALLLVNTLAFIPSGQLLIPLPKAFGQVITMGALVVAFGLALILNPRVRLRPSALLLLLSLGALAAVISSARLESGYGAFFRCFRLVLFLATLWLVSAWWRGDLRFARYHVRALGGILLTVLLGLVIAPGKAFSGPDGRLVGAIWPIPPTQVAEYAAVAAGLAILLFLSRNIDGWSAAIVTIPSIGLLLLSHTRTALLGLFIGLGVALLSLALSQARVRRALAWAIGLGVVVAAVFGQVIQVWLARGQDPNELADLTGRTKVWDLLLAQQRTPLQEVFGVGLTDKTFGGLAIDNTWLSVYQDLGWVGITIVAAAFASMLITALLRPPSPSRACALFLIAYCISATYTEVGLGDASPYVLHMAVAASLLVPTGFAAWPRLRRAVSRP